jgi:hypothetical protein
MLSTVVIWRSCERVGQAQAERLGEAFGKVAAAAGRSKGSGGDEGRYEVGTDKVVAAQEASSASACAVGEAGSAL